MTSTSPTRVLVLESGEACGRQARELLKGLRSHSYEVRSIAGFDGAHQELKKGSVDVILLDIASWKESFEKIIRGFGGKAMPVPVLVVVEPGDESLGVNALHCGAQDYIVRGSHDGATLDHVIRRAMERQRVVSELEHKSQEFHSNEARFLSVVFRNADGIVVVDANGIVRFMNPAAKQMFGSHADDMLDRVFPYNVKPGANLDASVECGDGKQMVYEMRAVESEWEGESAILVSIRDITLRKRAEEALRKSEERYSLAVRGSKDGLWDWNLKTDEVYFSPQWKAMLGYENHEVGTSTNEWFKRVHKDDIQRVRGDISAHLAGNTAHFENEHRLQAADGTYRWVLSRGTAVRDSRGKAIRIAGSQSNITERKEAEKNLKRALSDLKYALASEKVLLDELDKKNRELVELSITDGLTGLYNHRFIQERFDFEFKRAKRYDILLSCMLLDIDHFKLVNDTYGHQFGDYVLREIAGILKSNSRDVDICGRYGGEEFMIISNQDESGALQFATKLHSKVESHVFQQGEHSIHVTVSIGVTTFTGDVLSKHELIERADTALYKAKEDGRNLIRVWKPRGDEDETALDQGGIENLKKKFRSLSSQMRATYMESTNALLRAVDAKDHYSYQHSQNVSKFAVLIGRQMNMGEEDLEVLKYAGLLHDIGKIGVDEQVLVKKGALTFEEFEMLKKHPVIGINILKDVQFLEKEIPIILHHHERFDGTGYPQGLSGREIPLGARILGVADAFDAMTTDREFKRKLSYKEAVEELDKGRGTQFADEVVSAFMAIDRKELGAEENNDNRKGSA